MLEKTHKPQGTNPAIVSILFALIIAALAWVGQTASSQKSQEKQSPNQVFTDNNPKNN